MGCDAIIYLPLSDYGMCCDVIILDYYMGDEVSICLDANP